MQTLIAGNWKMHGLIAQLAEIESIAAAVAASEPPADILVCPPATLIARAAQLADHRIAIGGQDCHSENAGAFTGDVSAEMIKDAGASAVILGHSERRQGHGETNAIVAAKAMLPGAPASSRSFASSKRNPSEQTARHRKFAATRSPAAFRNE